MIVKNISTFKKFNEDINGDVSISGYQYNPKMIREYCNDPVNFPEYEKIKDIFEYFSDWCYQNLINTNVIIYKELNRTDETLYKNNLDNHISIDNDNVYHKIKDDNIYYKTYNIFVKNSNHNLPAFLFKVSEESEYDQKLKLAIERIRRCGFEVYKKQIV